MFPLIIKWIIPLLLTYFSTTGCGDPCTPQCRAGYECVEKACVTKCNPACDGSLVCNDDGECVEDTATSDSTEDSTTEEDTTEEDAEANESESFLEDDYPTEEEDF